MTRTLLDLSALATDLALEGHLVECDKAGQDWRDCSWCLWAVSVPEIDLLLGASNDARALDRSPAADTVPWVVATSELLRQVGVVNPAEVLVPSVRGLAQRLLRIVSTDLEPIRRRLRSAVASDGPIERRCLNTAATIAAAAIQRPEHAQVLERLPAGVRSRLLALSDTLSPEAQIAGLLPAVEHLHWKGLPVLRTQPEWRRRLAPDDPAGARSHQTTGAGLAPGSLEALVMESVIDRVTAEVGDVSDDLAHLAPPVTHTRAVCDQPHSEATRSLLWRIARIDWHLTFVDSGQADCWNARVENDRVTTDVPWPVAVAIAASETHGLVSATHQNRPTVHDHRCRDRIDT